jgi:hypothetical protein
MTVVSGTALLGGVTIPAGRTFTLVIDPDTALEEIVDATAVSTNTFTITRGIDGSSGQEHSAGAVVRHMAIGRDYRDANLHAEADASYNDGSGNAHTMHGIGSGEGVVVGTLKTQTLTNKTLTTPTISGGTLSGAVTVAATATVSGHIVVSGGTITGLSSAGMVTSSATPKDYVDSILGSATAASTSAAAANTSAVAASTSAANASASASAASTSAAAANTSAVAASTSASAASVSSASASTSAANASTSAAAANTSAVNASTSAANASASAASATTSQAAANTSAIAASTSAANALVSANSASAAASQAASAIQATIFDAKGDLIVASAADTAARLGIGTDGQILTAASTATYGLQWAAAPVSLPSQSGNAGKYLTTDGSTASWAAITTDPTPTVFLLMGA